MRNRKSGVRVDTTADSSLVDMDLKGKDVPATERQPRLGADAARKLGA